MRIVPVESIEQAQIVRIIRNILVGSFTTNNQQISSYDQAKWFNDSRRSLYLYYDDFCSPAGFGYLNWINQRLYATLGVLPEFQSQGFGTKIYNHLYDVATENGMELYLEIYGNNNASLIAAQKAGFSIIGFSDKIVTLVK